MKKLDITAQKIVQHTLQSAMEGGPNCSSKPVASQMRRAFLCLLLEKFTKSSNN